ncbi:glucosamine inositolphosphorylceramide transferase family protein [Rhodoplanes sp. Z2-YC6860]|uniref:glucosamine inositolphosphorylceramide transferase family protein n=1 Tax=Rhodoplanes sp. Z2-YC6860 TaxID=674703 RepID=UPI00078C04B3|nr:hypothetical protein [Rhodoplanes sp. Z2-YC6860]AMN43648.1 formyl transferase [Rhodoplanes sp. Z2-YC6860]
MTLLSSQAPRLNQKGLARSQPSMPAGSASLRDDKTRLAVILPRHRLWEWHRQLILHLVKRYDVAVFLDDRASPYRRAERLWLKLEQLAFPGGALAKPIAPEDSWRPVSEFNDIFGRIVINLSERSDSYAEAIELRYDGVLDSDALIERLLSQSSPKLSAHCTGTNGTLAASRLAIEDKFSIGRGLQAAFSRSISLIDRALCPTTGQSAGDGNATATPVGGNLARFVPRMIAHKVSSLVMKPFRWRQHWQVALRDGAGAFKVVEDDGARFYADPFLHRANGRTFLFVEEYPYADRRGLISAAEVVGDRLLAAPVPVLKRPYHLSYPLVFEHDGEFYMIPETGENRSVELYRAIEYPWKWELSAVLMQGAVFSDATILFHDGLWWLFMTADWFGASTQDELSIFYSETLQGDWKPHLTNPVKSDSRSSRPAGRIVQQGGRLFRPAQDCDRTYGAGIVWFEITMLTKTCFSEREMTAWDGQAELSMDGLHSFDQLGSLQAIDFNCSVARGVMRKNVSTIAPRRGGKLERSFSRASHCLQIDQV